MRIKFQGEDLGEWTGAPRLKEARMIKSTLGMLPGVFAEAVSEMDPDALSMLVALLKTRNGTHTAYSDVDGEITEFDVVLSDDEKRMAAEQENAQISPMIVAILKELGVDANAAHVTDVVIKHIRLNQEKQAQGKEEGESPLATSTGTTETTSSVTPEKSESSTSSGTSSTTTPEGSGSTTD